MESPETDTKSFRPDFSMLMTNEVLLERLEIGPNFVSSPLSFHVMPSLAAAGATGNTVEQLLSFLGPKGVDELNLLSSQISNLTSPVRVEKSGEKRERSSGPSPTLSFANGFWIDQRFKLKPSLGGVVREIYAAEAVEVDFTNKANEAARQANEWAKKETNSS